ncbi:MAG: hypothetical protein QM699_07835 [Amaricoccus sp.]|uniref:hypothetical protein n=1 Tax=Amaricoccus sp. TaxID=1872485 RepID=UPI0039E3B917
MERLAEWAAIAAGAALTGGMFWGAYRTFGGWFLLVAAVALFALMVLFVFGAARRERETARD